MPRNQGGIHREELRAIYEELWPLRRADHWEPSDGELVLCEHFRREMRGMEDEIDRLRRRLSGHVSAGECA